MNQKKWIGFIAQSTFFDFPARALQLNYFGTNPPLVIVILPAFAFKQRQSSPCGEIPLLPDLLIKI